MALTIFEQRQPWRVVLESTVAVLLIAVFDWKIHAQVPLALLYVLPAAFVGTGLSRWQVPLFGAFCALVAELADAFPWSLSEGIPRDALYLLAYTAAGLYVSEVVANRRREQEHLRAVELAGEVRQQAEEQLRLLIATSSLAILTSDEGGKILHANDAAERLFGTGDRSVEVEGRPIATLLPALARAPMLGRGPRQLRTMMQCQGIRADLEPFFADVWFSTYRTAEGGRLTAMVVDSSNDVRDREEANLQQVLMGSRLLVGAVSHEIRNVCAAIGFVQQNLFLERPDLDSSEEFKALRQLTSALERLAAVELSQVKHQASHVHLSSFLRELRIIVGPSLREAGIAVAWETEDPLPTVWADPQSLLQVFLNLIRNTQAALEGRANPTLRLSVTRSETAVQVRIADNGEGVSSPEHLFHPFRTPDHKGGQIGFGLYLSRALVTSFRGDLRYEPSPDGAVFLVELLPAELAATSDEACCS